MRTATAATLAGAAAWTAWRAVRGRRGSLEGRTVAITGGSRGLGLVLAREFGGEDCPVALCARDEKELERAREDLDRRGIRALAVRCDVSRPEEVEDFVDETESRLGPIHVLVNNAGIIQVGPLSSLSREHYEREMAVNFGGALNASLAVLPGMLERGVGRIVNITSIGGRVPIPHLHPYTCSKFALVGLSEGLRVELAGTGVKVTTVVPGLMRTGSPVQALFTGSAREEFAWFSLASSLPITTTSAERAARRIVRAARRGEAFVTLTWQARLLRLAHDLFPSLTVDLIGLGGRLLPGAPEAVDEAVRGMKLAHPLAPSRLTALATRAARRNNEYGGEPRPSPAHARQAGLSPDSAEVTDASDG